MPPTVAARSGAGSGPARALLQGGFDALQQRYAASLDWALAHQRSMLWVTAAAAAATLALYVLLPKGFLPQQDTGSILISTEAPVGVSFAALSQRQQALMPPILRDPAVAAAYSWIGESDTPNQGRIMVLLKPYAERDTTAFDVMRRLQHRLAAVPGIRAHMRARQEVEAGGRASRAQFQYTLVDYEADQLYAWAPRVQAALQALPQLRDVNSDMEMSVPGLDLALDRDRAASLGIATDALDNTLYDALGQRQIATVDTDVGQDPVILETLPQTRRDAADFENVDVVSASGAQVPLAAVTAANAAVTPLEINHEGPFPAVTLSFDLAPGATLSEATAAIAGAVRVLGLPAALHGGFAGTAHAFTQALPREAWLIAAAIFAVYIVLGVLYESYIHPLTILSSLPSAGLGAVLALAALHFELDLITLIGLIMLVGIVKKNAIMMVDFAIEARQAGATSAAAIRAAALARLRPILMTSLAAVFGALPLAIGSGAGGELRQPLGVALVGGLLVSQLLTLYTVPVAYLALERLIQGRSEARDRAFGAASGS